MTPILVIAGCTATGKSGVAMKLASELHGEIVNADSVQVVRGFDIGSAKPSLEDRHQVPHHVVDVIDPHEHMDAMGFAARADRAIEVVHGRGHVPIVVGGTGLWIRALLRGLVGLPPVDAVLRKRITDEVAHDGAPAQHARLREVDPIAAAAIHENDAVRIVRALEVFEQLGEPLGKLRLLHGKGAPRYKALFAVLDSPREVLYGRIVERADGMIERGWVAEVRSLVERVGPEVRALRSVGYRQMLMHVRDGLPLEEARRQIIKATKRYAHRQRTWFGTEPGVDWRAFPGEVLTTAALERIRAHFRGAA